MTPLDKPLPVDNLIASLAGDPSDRAKAAGRCLRELKIMLVGAQIEGRTVPPQRIVPGVNDFPEVLEAMRATCGVLED